MTADFAEAGWGEDPPVGRISGSGRTGWIAAVSLLAPFAVIELGDMVAFPRKGADSDGTPYYAVAEQGLVQTMGSRVARCQDGEATTEPPEQSGLASPSNFR